jgi:hypothetical protein
MSEEWTELDDAVEEVRAVRRRLSARFDDDPAKIAEYYMEYQKQFGDRLLEPDGIEKPSGPGRSAA